MRGLDRCASPKGLRDGRVRAHLLQCRAGADPLFKVGPERGGRLRPDARNRRLKPSHIGAGLLRIKRRANLALALLGEDPAALADVPKRALHASEHARAIGFRDAAHDDGFFGAGLDGRAG